jgi:hypothetical protein
MPHKVLPSISQSFIDVPINQLPVDRHQTHGLGHWKPDSDEDDDFLVIESTKIESSCPYRFLPFSQSADMCNRKVHNWLKQIWFLPSDWRVSLKIIQPKPQYVPFFVFDVTTSTSYEATVLVDSRDGSSPGKKWLPAVGMPGGYAECVLSRNVTGSFSCVYSEIIVCGSCSVNVKLVQKLLNRTFYKV